MYKYLIPLLLIVCISSCKEETSKLLCKKWKTSKLVNTKMEAEIRDMEYYIDTVGTVDKEVSQTLNLDSFKLLMRETLKANIEEQKTALENTSMYFFANGLVIATSIAGTDSAKWTLTGTSIKVDEAALKGTGESMTYEIKEISKDKLVLQVIDYGDTVTATMLPVK